MFSLFLPLSMSPIVLAAEKSQFSVKASSFHTTDEFSLQSYGLIYRNNRRDLLFPYESSENKAVDFGFYAKLIDGNLEALPFSSYGFGFLIGKKFTKAFHIESRLGGNEFSNNLGVRVTQLTPKLSVRWIPLENLYFDFSSQRIFMFERGYSPGPVHDALLMWSFSPRTTYYPHENFRISLNPEWSWPSDGNMKTSVEGSLMYGVSVWPTWFWVGVGAEKISNKKKSNYWSPSRFHSYGLRFELNQMIVGSWSGVAGLNLSKIKEENSNSGNGHYMNIGIKYGERNSQNFQINYINIRSVQSSTKWESNGMRLLWNYFF